MKYNLSEIMKTAWQFVKVNGFTMSEALKQAWLNIKLKVKMFKGVVKFYFEKVDGTVREAWGTLASRYIMAEPTGRGSSSPLVQCYWDCEKSAWRCYKIANLLRIA